MADILSVLVGGVIGIAGSLAVKVFDQKDRKRALRAAFKAEISAILMITAERKHEKFAEQMIGLWRSGHDAPVEFFGLKDGIPKDPVFEANIGKIGDLGADVAGSIGEFYMLLAAVRTTMKAVSDGSFATYPPQDRAVMFENDLELWRKAKLIGEYLIRKL